MKKFILIGIIAITFSFNTVNATVLETPYKLLHSNSGTNTYTSSSLKTLDTFTLPSYNTKDSLEIEWSWKTNNVTSVSKPEIGYGVSNTLVTNLFEGTLSTNTGAGTCKGINQYNNTTMFFRCELWTHNGGTPTQILTNAVDLSGQDIKFQTNIATASSRTIDWQWRIYVKKGASATTTITEEDGGCHITAGTGISISSCTITNTLPENTTTLAWGSITSTPTTLSGYGITNAVPNTRTLTIDTISYDLSADRSWTTTGGGGGGCSTFNCLTGTDNVVQLTPTSEWSIQSFFLFFTFFIILAIIIVIIRKLI